MVDLIKKNRPSLRLTGAETAGSEDKNMATETRQPESFGDFINSLNYGKRTDLNFKFLAKLDPEQAAQFIQGLLWNLGDSFIEGNLKKTMKHVYDGQIEAYNKTGKWIYDDGPFTPLGKPISESRITMLSSSGHFVAGDDPEPFGIKRKTRAFNQFLRYWCFGRLFNACIYDHK